LYSEIWSVPVLFMLLLCIFVEYWTMHG
jgi:hypothetical protein